MRTKSASPARQSLDLGDQRRQLILLYQAERDGMVRLAHLLTGSVAVAEDVVQDAFLRVHDVLDDVEQPGAYLRRTVVNLCHSHHRRRAVEDRWRSRQPPPLPQLPPELDEVWRSLGALTERQRSAVVLRFYLDLKVDEIAELLEVPAGTVKSDIHRGLAALSEEIQP